ncbi:hypothetical protein LWI28_012764 [Acer negundo]|uniref:RNase H type-1 domain-containing protein n=1 Tax=Acer negundo TaxID=4023 RepID=A0AAD5NLN7_ACENE|nr:hypothetical protein LWI28_012764 [Acer negundo]
MVELLFLMAIYASPTTLCFPPLKNLNTIVEKREDANYEDVSGKSLNGVGAVSWQLPVEGTYKVNSDAAIDKDRQAVGIGLVIRDHQGMVLMATSTQCIHARYGPLVAKAAAILRGVILAIETGLTPFVVETDALGVANLVKAGFAPSADIGLIIEGILFRLWNFGGETVVYVFRNANFVADTLSKMALGPPVDYFWRITLRVERFIPYEYPV